MSLYVNEAEGDKYIDGVNEALAVQHAGRQVIEIWDTDAETHYGNVPATFNAEQINACLRFYQAGEKRGIEHGKRLKQHEVLSVLGLGKVDLNPGRSDD